MYKHLKVHIYAWFAFQRLHVFPTQSLSHIYIYWKKRFSQENYYLCFSLHYGCQPHVMQVDLYALHSVLYRL